MTAPVHAFEAERAVMAQSLRAALQPPQGAPDFTPREVGAMLRLARELTDQGKLDKADTVLTGVLAARPDDPGLLRSLARLRQRQGRVEEALTLLAMVDLLEPDDLANGLDLALACLQAGRRTQGMELLDIARERCERLAPGSVLHQRVQALLDLQQRVGTLETGISR